MPITTYSDVEICSAALNEVGKNPINSIANPVGDIEATCARLFPLVVSTLLSRHDWNFATPIRQLVADADVTTDEKMGYENAYTLPANLIAGPFAVFVNNDLKRPYHRYLNANGYILCDEDIVHVSYRAWPDISIWPPYFVDLVVVALAARLAQPLADSTSLATEKRIMAFGAADKDGDGGMFGDAKRLDAMAQPMTSLFQNGDPISATRY